MKVGRSWVARGLAVLAILLVGFGAGALVFGRRPPSSAPSGASKTLYTCSMHPQVIQDKPGNCPICGMKLTPVRQEAGAKAPVGKKQEDKKIKYWWDPMMNPPYISDKPGKSPMGMDLIPMYEDGAGSGSSITIDPVVTQNMGIRAVAVQEGPFAIHIRSVGYLREAETHQHDVALKVGGWIERLDAHTEGMFLERGASLFELYSPDVLTTRNELLIAKQALEALPPEANERARGAAERLVESAKERLALWGIPDEEVRETLSSGRARRAVLFRSPAPGFLVEKNVVQGSAVEPRQKLLRIVDLSTLWVDAQIYERDLPHLSLRQKAKAQVSGLPGKSFEGEVIFISPRVDATTRTAVARMAFANPELLLKPGMYATVILEAKVAERATIVPREAVIATGTRQVAFVVRDQGRFEPRKVEMGVESEGNVQILSGLAAGEKVVTSGQFLLDAESRMREAIEKLTAGNLSAKPSSPSGGKSTEKPKADAQTRPPQGEDSVVAHYLEMAGRLAEDRETGKELREKLIASAKELAAAGGGTKPLAERLLKEAEGFPETGIEVQRKKFETLSAAMIALAEKSPPAKKLFVIHCPMKKADWIQTDEKVRNPYFGKSMPDCGQVTRTIPAEVEAK